MFKLVFIFIFLQAYICQQIEKKLPSYSQPSTCPLSRSLVVLSCLYVIAFRSLKVGPPEPKKTLLMTRDQEANGRLKSNIRI